MNKPQILIVEDDNAVANLISATLETQDYAYKRAATGAGAVMEALSCKPDVVLLDLGLPDMDGVEIIKKIRSWSNMPIIVVSARSEDFDKVSALDAGADDYLTKPFGINELMARVNSLIRRYTTLNPVTGNEAATMLLKDMVIDKINRTVTVQNLPVDLTGKEFDLLLFLASNKGRVFTKKQLYTQVWTEEYDFDDNNLMAFISKLRKKIEPNPEQPFYIQTVRGVGYRFNKEA
mgnify:CR=1 FL=1